MQNPTLDSEPDVELELEDAVAAAPEAAVDEAEAVDADEATDEADDDADGDADDEATDDGDERDSSSLLVQEGDIAADYLERLLDIVDYDGDIDLDVENDRAVVAIVGTGLQSLVGPQGKTLDALQELTRLAVHQKTGVRSRLMLDVSGHRQARRNELGALAAETAREVLASGESIRLTPMNPFERKVVHDVIGSIDGVRSDSDGEEPNRCVVVLLDQ
ncbi:spoIIIJ-associated protein [Jatrophihabitans sp. GAS493]|uniref:Jag family protein n=1 Tax=Jatrophihabitans sp. GAS493 TaxID=1907575 RepID=UPI000BB697FD|nr:R3H domain-containing nucleic acid-binding protein [Jatrophihabitans sp. GAS493]SOD71229.1 spoIIIJ-associated protein [Jatrophihabitans sp. GAS493]